MKWACATLAVMLVGCASTDENRCVEVVWEQALPGGSMMCDVVVRPDGTLGVLASGMLTEFDAQGHALASHPIRDPTGTALGCGDLHADVQNRWWVTGWVRGADAVYESWLVRLDDGGKSESVRLSIEEGDFLGSIVEWGDRLLVGGSRAAPQGQEVWNTQALVVEVDASLEVTQAWVSDPRFAGVSRLFVASGALLILARRPSLDWAPGELLRFDALDQPPVWSRSVGILGSTSDGIEGSASDEDHVVFLVSTSELIDPDTAVDPPETPQTRPRWSIEAWTARGDLAWTHDLATEPASWGRLAVSDDVILARTDDLFGFDGASSTWFAVDPQRDRMCQAQTSAGRAVRLEAAPTWGEAEFAQVVELQADDGPHYGVTRLRAHTGE